MRFAICAVALLTSGCGGILDQTDAGDAATHDAGSETGDAGGPPGFFACGEPGNYIYCNPTSQYCLLVRSSHSRDYSCQLADGGAPTCAGDPPASAPYECGCYAGPSGEITITVCQ